MNGNISWVSTDGKLPSNCLFLMSVSYYFLHTLYSRSVLHGVILPAVEYSSTRLGSLECWIEVRKLVNKLEAVQVPNI